MDRRDFLRTVIVGGAVLSLDTAFTAQHLEAGTQSLNTIGECKRLSPSNAFPRWDGGTTRC